MNFVYQPGYPPNGSAYINGQQTFMQGAHPLMSQGAMVNGRPISGGQQAPAREPPMLTMCASDPEETGGPGCAVAGISRERVGACFKYTWIREWKYPTTQELLYVQRRLLDFLIQYGLRQADMCEALGLVTTYMSLFLKDVHSSNLGSRRRAEMYCVLNEFFQLIDEEAFDMEAIFRVRARRRHTDRCFRLPEESLLPQLPPDDPLDASLDRPIQSFPGISRRHGGRLLRYSSVHEWIHPSIQEATELRDRLVGLLNLSQVKPVDLADGLGLIAPYLVHFLSEPFHPLVGKRRRGELYSVCMSYLKLVDTGKADVKHLTLLRDLRRASENTVRNSRAPAPVYKRGPSQLPPAPVQSQKDNVNQGPMRAVPLSDGSNNMKGNWNQQGPPITSAPTSAPLQPVNVPGLKVGARPPLPQPLAEEGLANNEFSQLLLNGVPNSVPLDVSFSNHFAKWLQPLSQGGGDPRVIPEVPADWRGSDFLLYQHPESRVAQVPQNWETDGTVALNQEYSPLHTVLRTVDKTYDTNGTKWDPTSENALQYAADATILGEGGSMSELWQWQRITSGLFNTDDTSNGSFDVLPCAPLLPHWSPSSGSQEHHLYRYLFNRWREVISHACSVYQKKGRSSLSNTEQGGVSSSVNKEHVPTINSMVEHHNLIPSIPPTIVKQEANESYKLSEILSSNWNSNQITSSFLSYNMWVNDPCAESEVFSKWNQLSSSLLLGTGKEGNTTEKVITALDLNNAIRRVTDSRIIGDDSPIIPICLVITTDNTPYNDKAPGYRSFETRIENDAPDLNALTSGEIGNCSGLYSKDTHLFLENVNSSMKGGEGLTGRDGLYLTLTSSCLLPHHEWLTFALNDPISTVEWIAETRLGRELGMSCVAVERAALGLRRQALVAHRLFRCFRIARNAVNMMGRSGLVTTAKEAAKNPCPPPFPKKHIEEALLLRPVEIDIVMEDEQCRVRDLVIWDLSVPFNEFCYEIVDTIMVKGTGEPSRQTINVGGASLQTLMVAHHGDPPEQSADDLSGPKSGLPERCRVAIDIGVRRAMMNVICSFCRDVHLIWNEFMNLSERGIGEEIDEDIQTNIKTHHLVLRVPPIDWRCLTTDSDTTDMIEELPFLFCRIWQAINWMGTISLPIEIETLIYQLIGHDTSNIDTNIPVEQRADLLMKTYLSTGITLMPWDPYEALRKSKERIIQQQMQKYQSQTHTGATARAPDQPTSNRSQGQPTPPTVGDEDRKGPRRSTRVMAKQRENTAITLREKLGLSSSSDSDNFKTRKSSKGRRKRRKSSDSESDDWGEDDSDGDESDESGSDEEVENNSVEST